jgi:hypothetical protein
MTQRERDEGEMKNERNSIVVTKMSKIFHHMNKSQVGFPRLEVDSAFQKPQASGLKSHSHPP